MGWANWLSLILLGLLALYTIQDWRHDGEWSYALWKRYSRYSGGDGQWLEVQGTRLYYEVHGQGEPLLLLHGGLGFIETWQKQIPALARHYQIIALDNRNHGRSTDDGQHLSYAQMAQDALALLDALKIKKVHVLGWSDGGSIALEMALQAPERVHSLLLVATRFHYQGVQTDRQLSAEQVMAETAGLQAFYQQHAPQGQRWSDLVQRSVRLWASQPELTPEQLSHIQLPSLLLYGTKERYVEPQHAQQLADVLAAKLIWFPEAGHTLPQERAAAFNYQVLQFLDKKTF